jgi:hypothetical protein
MPAALSWEPIETAPRDGRQIIVIDADGQISIVEWTVLPDGTSFWEFGHLMDGRRLSLGRQATHWLPLPKPPMISRERGR